MESYKARVAEFEKVLESPTIDLKRVRKLTFEGCPSERGSTVRPRCWKLLLNYLPTERAAWDEDLRKHRATYKQFIDEMIVQPGTKKYENSRTDVTFEDHPLNPNPDSQWSQYFKDNEMLLQIDKDCKRLCPELAFFQSATDYPCKELVCSETGMETLRKRVERSVIKAQNVSKNRQGITVTDIRRPRTRSVEEYMPLEAGQEAHWEVVERILFIYAKLNPGLAYVQGMNEVLGPIYYTFASNSELSEQEFAEPDAFWCFTNMMGEIRDNFLKTMDDSDSGIGNWMTRLMSMLKDKDTALWLKLQQQDMKPQYYAFRWLTLLLSQEFDLPDIQRLWDSLLADSARFDFLISVCCAMLILQKAELLKGDFASNMKRLQNYPSVDIQVILRKAVQLSER